MMPPFPKPSMRFTHSKPLRNKTLKVLDAIDEDEDPTTHRKALGDVVVELSDTGMRAYFIDPLSKLKMGFVVNQSANLGISSAMRVLGPTVRNIIGRMDKKQLRQVSKQMRLMMA